MQADDEWCHFVEKIEVPLSRPLKNHTSSAVAVCDRFGVVAAARDKEVHLFDFKGLLDRAEEAKEVAKVAVGGVVSQVVLSDSGRTLAVAFESSVAVFRTSEILRSPAIPLFTAALEGLVTQLAVNDRDVLCALTSTHLSLFVDLTNPVSKKLEGVKSFDLLKTTEEILVILSDSITYLDYNLKPLKTSSVPGAQASKALAIKQLSDKQVAILMLKQNLHELWLIPSDVGSEVLEDQITILDDPDLTPYDCPVGTISDIKGTILEITAKGLLLCTSGAATSLLIAFKNPGYNVFYYDDTAVKASAGWTETRAQHLFRGLQVAYTAVSSDDTYEYEYRSEVYQLKQQPHLVGINEAGTILIWTVADLREANESQYLLKLPEPLTSLFREESKASLKEPPVASFSQMSARIESSVKETTGLTMFKETRTETFTTQREGKALTTEVRTEAIPSKEPKAEAFGSQGAISLISRPAELPKEPTKPRTLEDSITMVQDELVRTVEEALQSTQQDLMLAASLLEGVTKTAPFSELAVQAKDYSEALMEKTRALASELPIDSCIKGFAEVKTSVGALQNFVSKTLCRDSQEANLEPGMIEVLKSMNYSATYYDSLLMAVEEIAQSYRRLQHSSPQSNRITSNSLFRVGRQIPGTSRMKSQQKTESPAKPVHVTSALRQKTEEVKATLQTFSGRFAELERALRPRQQVKICFDDVEDCEGPLYKQQGQAVGEEAAEFTEYLEPGEAHNVLQMMLSRRPTGKVLPHIKASRPSPSVNAAKSKPTLTASLKRDTSLPPSQPVQASLFGAENAAPRLLLAPKAGVGETKGNVEEVKGLRAAPAVGLEDKKPLLGAGASSKGETMTVWGGKSSFGESGSFSASSSKPEAFKGQSVPTGFSEASPSKASLSSSKFTLTATSDAPAVKPPSLSLVDPKPANPGLFSFAAASVTSDATAAKPTSFFKGATSASTSDPASKPAGLTSSSDKSLFTPFAPSAPSDAKTGNPLFAPDFNTGQKPLLTAPSANPSSLFTQGLLPATSKPEAKPVPKPEDKPDLKSSDAKMTGLFTSFGLDSTAQVPTTTLFSASSKPAEPHTFVPSQKPSSTISVQPVSSFFAASKPAQPAAEFGSSAFGQASTFEKFSIPKLSTAQTTSFSGSSGTFKELSQQTASGFPSPQPSLFSAQSGFPTGQSGFPSGQSGLSSGQFGFPSVQSGFPSGQSGLPSAPTGFPSQQAVSNFPGAPQPSLLSSFQSQQTSGNAEFFKPRK
jgi:hypothetical protein